MPAASAEMATATSEPSTSTATPRKAVSAPEKKYKCQFCNRAFSRSEHRSRHERSRKLNYFLLLRGASRQKSRTEGQSDKVFSLLTSTLQTLKRDPFNARNVEAPSFVETFSCATTGPSMQKIREYLWCQEEESVAGLSHHQPQGLQSRR
jgi:hypothetical protein